MMLLYVFFLVENRNIGSDSMVRSGKKKTPNGYDFETDFSQIRLEKLPSKSASFEEKAATASEFSGDK